MKNFPDKIEGLDLYHVIMGNISQTLMFDVLPLDIILHTLFGFFIIWCFSKYKNGMIWSFVTALSIALVKEWIDSHTLRYTLKEGIIDTVATIFFPLLFLISESIRKVKDRKTPEKITRYRKL